MHYQLAPPDPIWQCEQDSEYVAMQIKNIMANGAQKTCPGIIKAIIKVEIKAAAHGVVAAIMAVHGVVVLDVPPGGQIRLNSKMFHD